MLAQLTKIDLFRGMAVEQLTIAFGKLRYQTRDYEPETIIAYAGDNCEYLYILLSGSVRGEVANFKSKNVIVDDVNAPNTFAEAFLFASQNKILVNIVVTERAKVLFLPKKEFLKLLHSEALILENYLRATSNRFVTVSQKLRFLTLKNVKQKLAHYVLGLQQKNTEKAFFPLGKTHEELASLLGITRPALTKNLLELQEQGLVEVRNKQIRIIDKGRLIDC